MNSFILKGNQYTFRLRPLTTDLEKCKIKYVKNNPYGNSVVGGNEKIPIIPDSIIIKESETKLECTRKNLLFSKEKIKEYIKLVEESTSYNRLAESLWKTAFFTSSDFVQNCTNYLDSYLGTNFKRFSYNSSKCSYEIQTLDWENGK